MNSVNAMTKKGIRGFRQRFCINEVKGILSSQGWLVVIHIDKKLIHQNSLAYFSALDTAL
jgi:hypothetical protein